MSPQTAGMTSTTNPIHPASVAIDPEERGAFQPFTDLRTAAQKARDGEGFAVTLRTSDGGESAASIALRAALHESIRMGSHSHSIADAGHTHDLYARHGEASNDHDCAGRMSPPCMSEADFIASMERQRAHWNATIDAMLDATVPGWRDERARQPSEEQLLAAIGPCGK